MSKTVLVSNLFAFLLLSGFVPIASAHLPTTYKEYLVIDTISEPQTLDPAWCNDAASGDVIMNVYSTLVAFKRVWMGDPYTAGKTDEFEPILAISVPSMVTISQDDPETGLHWVQEMNFTLRSDVRFHDQSLLTAEDVEYSFERLLVQDRDGGPQGNWYFPLLGVYGGPSPTDEPLWHRKIDKAIQRSGNTITLKFVQSFPEVTWLQTMSQAWSGVVKKSWAVSKGDFDGDLVGHTWYDLWTTLHFDPTYETWKTWHNPAESFIEGDGMMGTGPYKFTSWEHGVSWQIDRFAEYWDLWPARIQSGSSERLPAYISTVLWNYRPSWVDRRTRFIAGDSDWTDVLPCNEAQLLGLPDIICYLRYFPTQTMRSHWTRGWVRGWYYNPMYSGLMYSGFPYYHLWKQGTHMGDANLDYGVDVGDRAFISWRLGSPLGSTANIAGDINGGPSAPPQAGIPDGRVDVVDMALVSAYWDDAPRGPAHP